MLKDDDSNMTRHAIRELEAIGQIKEDPEFAASLVNAVRAFSSYGHSGGSAAIATEMLTRLIQFRNLGPLTTSPDEWIDRTEMSGEPMWQNKRDSLAFSTDGGKTHYTLSDLDVRPSAPGPGGMH